VCSCTTASWREYAALVLGVAARRQGRYLYATASYTSCLNKIADWPSSTSRSGPEVMTEPLWRALDALPEPFINCGEAGELTHRAAKRVQSELLELMAQLKLRCLCSLACFTLRSTTIIPGYGVLPLLRITVLAKRRARSVV